MDFLQHSTVEQNKPKRGRPRKEVKKDIEFTDTEICNELSLTFPFEEYKSLDLNIADKIGRAHV